ncbi:MAG: ABC transporter permease [Clostridia bacterium]|nr:ABC transporter permease [Clostridia bacterium]
MKRISLPWKNLIRKPGRTCALVLLTAFLALSVFGGSLVVLSLRSGLNSLEARLGADIIVVPASATSKINVQELLLQGTTGTFYMNAANLKRAAEVNGVEKLAAQTFLASLKAECCSSKVQVIGFDPKTDFIVQPWIAQSLAHELGEGEVVVGSKVEAEVGETIRLYNARCKVAARLSPTGTGLDTAVYCSHVTMKMLLKAAEDKGISHKVTSDSDDLISAIYVKVKDGYDIDEVTGNLNLHVRKVSAVRTKSMITDVSDSLAAVSGTVTLLIIAVWVLAFIILLIAFAMISNERKREFAVLRLVGTSRRMLSRMVLAESALSSFLGALAGIGVAAAVVLPFATLIETSLNLPYLTPGTGTVLLLALGTLIATVFIGSLASAFAAFRLSRIDPGAILREGN